MTFKSLNEVGGKPDINFIVFLCVKNVNGVVHKKENPDDDRGCCSSEEQTCAVRPFIGRI